jgi:hypothetical protein
VYSVEYVCLKLMTEKSPNILVYSMEICIFDCWFVYALFSYLIVFCVCKFDSHFHLAAERILFSEACAAGSAWICVLL